MKNKRYIQWIWASTLLFLGMVMLRNIQIRGNNESSATVEGALGNAVTPNRGEYLKKITKELVRFENEEYVVVFYQAVKDQNEEALVMAKLKKLEENAYHTIYVTPMEIYTKDQNSLDQNIIREEELIRHAINASVHGEDIWNLNDSKGFFLRGISIEENIQNLKIENQEPTQIIPYESLGKKRYFWYYENFESDKILRDEWKIELDE